MAPKNGTAAMKTILVAGSTTVYNRLENIISTWDNRLALFSSDSYETTLQALEKTIVNLLILPFDANDDLFLKKVTNLTRIFPYIPLILITNGRNSRLQPGSEPDGVSRIIDIDNPENFLLEEIKEQLQTETKETVQGIPLHSFLQILECEEKTCTLEINSRQKRGFLYIANGTLLDAETGSLQGEKAAEHVLSWPDPSITLRPFNGLRRLQVQQPLISIIMNAFQLKSKAGIMHQDFFPLPAGKHQLPMQHQSTRDRKLPIEIGEKILIQFSGNNVPLESRMAGMIPGQLLLVTTPDLSGLNSLKPLVDNRREVLMKFLDRGRAWIFKARPIHCVDSPGPLLMLDYPGIIHYHELGRERRTPIFIPATLHLDSEKELYGTLIDLSNNGSLYRIKKSSEAETLFRTAINRPVEIRCLLPGIKEEQQIQGRIRNIRKRALEIRVGVEFEPFQSHLPDTIGRYLRSLEMAVL